MKERIGLVIPTFNAGRRWEECLQALSVQSLQPNRRLIIDSGSADQTVEQAAEQGFEVLEIPNYQFNHGGTRQKAIRLIDDCEIVVFLTQDAVLADEHALMHLVSCFEDPMVAVSYGRQLPHLDSDPIEAHARLFNYGSEDQRKNLLQRGAIGAKAYFCSNSFAAYRRSILVALGGFNEHLILGEDAEYAARAIKAGYTNFYCARALARHSHPYTAKQTFLRYFDIGVFHAKNTWLAEDFGSQGGEGLSYVRSELRYLLKIAPLQIPRSLGHTLAKALGYHLGKQERHLPVGLKRYLSLSPGYWVR